MKKLLQCFFFWRVKYPSRDEFNRKVSDALTRKQLVVILTHDIGLCNGNKPGRGNALMAQELKRVTEMYPSVPVLAQLGVAKAVEELGVPVRQMFGPPSPGASLDRSTDTYNSWTVVKEQKEWLQKHNMWTVLALTLTTPFHMPRVKWIMEKQGFTNILPIPLPSLRQRDYMDPESLYLSVRIAGKFPGGMSVSYCREILARLLFLKKGWM